MRDDNFDNNDLGEKSDIKMNTHNNIIVDPVWDDIKPDQQNTSQPSYSGQSSDNTRSIDLNSIGQYNGYSRKPKHDSPTKTLFKIVALLLFFISIIMLIVQCSETSNSYTQLVDSKDLIMPKSSDILIDGEALEKNTGEPIDLTGEEILAMPDSDPSYVLEVDIPGGVFNFDVPSSSCHGVYNVHMPMGCVVGPGPLNTDAYYYKDDQKRILFHQSKRKVDPEEFDNNWNEYTKYIYEKGIEYFGPYLAHIEFGIATLGDVKAYVVYYQVFDGYGDDSTIDFTTCFRFTEHFYVEYTSVSHNEDLDFPMQTMCAALLFEDLAASEEIALQGTMFDGIYPWDPDDWALPTSPIFELADTMADWSFKGFGTFDPVDDPRADVPGLSGSVESDPDKETVTGDDFDPDEIVWGNSILEAIAREITNKESGPIYESDLSFVTSLDIKQSNPNSDSFNVTISPKNTKGLEKFDFNLGEITDVSGLGHFRNVKKLELRLPHIKTLDGIGEMPSVEALTAYLPLLLDTGDLTNMPNMKFFVGKLNSDISDISFLGELPKLETIAITGDYSKGIKDISFLKNCIELDALLLEIPIQGNVDIFFKLPKLEYLDFISDLSSDELIDVAAFPGFKQLFINGKNYRDKAIPKATPSKTPAPKSTPTPETTPTPTPTPTPKPKSNKPRTA